jgi:hypothetical protein
MTRIVVDASFVVTIAVITNHEYNAAAAFDVQT